MKIKPFYLYSVVLIIFISVCLLWAIRNNTFEEKATVISYRDKDVEKSLSSCWRERPARELNQNILAKKHKK